jgi:hypothetical protein
MSLSDWSKEQQKKIQEQQRQDRQDRWDGLRGRRTTSTNIHSHAYKQAGERADGFVRRRVRLGATASGFARVLEIMFQRWSAENEKKKSQLI